MSKYPNERLILQETNDKLLQELSNQGIRKLQLSSIGNSISTGFSVMSNNKPLLKRNEILRYQAEGYSISLETHQFSRSENNSDEHLHEWLLKNKKESEFNAETRRDYHIYLQGNNPLLSEQEIIKFYPITQEIDKGITEALFTTEEGLANIVIANVGTGAFLDNITRQGRHKITGGIKKDTRYIEAVLGTIQLNNRENYANTQVYLCGAPRIINTPATSIFINRHLKDMSKRYANVVYVPSFSRNIVYHSNNFPIPLPDPHYNEEEYLHLLNMTEEKMIENYQPTDYTIKIDRNFVKRSREIEMSERKQETRDEILTTIEQYANLIEESGKDRNQFLHQTKNYLLERYPYDYYFLDRKAIKESSKVLAK